MKNQETLQREATTNTPEDSREDEVPSFGHYLAHLRENSGLTKREAARLARITPAYLGRLEKDQIKSPSLEVARALADTYGVPVDALAERSARAKESELERRIVETEDRITEIESEFAFISWNSRAQDVLDLNHKELYLEILEFVLSKLERSTRDEKVAAA